MALPKYYSTGLISIANGATSFTGNGTAWLNLIKADDRLTIQGYSVRIASIESNGAGTLAQAWPGTPVVDGAYEIEVVFDGPEFQLRTRQLLEQLNVLETSGRGIVSTYDEATTDSDPGNGNFKLNGLPAVATRLYLDNLDIEGADISAEIDTWDDSANTTRGRLWMRSIDVPATFYSYDVTGSIADGTGYRKVTLTYVGGSGTLADGDEVTFFFTPHGEKGDGLDWDARTATLAGLLDYENQAVGYRVLVDDNGNGRSAVYELENSGSPTDWSDPIYVSGEAATVAVGTVTTLAAGASATVSNTGDGKDAVFAFGIPQGSGLDFDVQVDTLAGLLDYENQAVGYRVLVLDVGDGRAAVYILENSGSPTDWSAPSYVTGEQGSADFRRVRVVDTTGAAVATAYENGDTIDGVVLVTGDMVLRATGGGNAADGVYTVPASGAASRHASFDTYDEHPGCYFSVMEGTNYADTLWRCASDKGGTLGTTALTFRMADQVITAQMFGAVLDGTAGDQALVKKAWKAAVAIGRPFLVPRAGMPDGGWVVQVPEDFSTVQAAHNAMLDWIFPGVTPRYADTTENHEAQTLIHLSVAAGEYVSSGQGIVWNHPFGNLILLKGRDAVGLTFASLQATSYASGVHFVRIRFSTWPATDPVVGNAMRVLLPTGTGHYQALEGGWRISAVDAVNKDITLAVYSRELVAALVMTLTGGTFVYLPTQFRFTNLPVSGADVGGFDVFTTLRVEDISVSGSASGTNAADVDGIITRQGAKVFLGQHTVVLEWNRCGVWVLDGGFVDVSYSGICGNGMGLNVIEGAIAIGGYVGIQGNETYNVVANTGAHVTLTNAGFDGCGGIGLAVLAGADAVVSGHANYCDKGIVASDGAVANINDTTAQNNTTRDAEANGAHALIIGTTLANIINTFPPKNYRDRRGNLVSSKSGIAATIYNTNTTWNPGSIANGAQEELVVAISGVTVGMHVEVIGNVSQEGMRLWGAVSSAGNVSCFYTNNTGVARDLGLHTIYITVTGAEG